MHPGTPGPQQAPCTALRRLPAEVLKPVLVIPSLVPPPLRSCGLASALPVRVGRFTSLKIHISCLNSYHFCLQPVTSAKPASSSRWRSCCQNAFYHASFSLSVPCCQDASCINASTKEQPVILRGKGHKQQCRVPSQNHCSVLSWQAKNTSPVQPRKVRQLLPYLVQNNSEGIAA